jgi:hypothetical protein
MAHHFDANLDSVDLMLLELFDITVDWLYLMQSRFR